MAQRPKKIRLDQLIAGRGLCPSREKAKALIMAGLVDVDGRRVDKPGSLTGPESRISIRKKSSNYVSRGGEKLKAALSHFEMDVEGLTLLDIGASTGGFTDCLLKRGASRVIAIDVGYGQLDWGLRNDPRVTVMEKANARYLKRDDIGPDPDGAVIDVSFISLRLIIPAVMAILPERGFIIALIKPQFEAGRGKVGKRGVVRDPEVHREVIEGLKAFFAEQGLRSLGVIPSPILGPKGNREFLTCLLNDRETPFATGHQEDTPVGQE